MTHSLARQLCLRVRPGGAVWFRYAALSPFRLRVVVETDAGEYGADVLRDPETPPKVRAFTDVEITPPGPDGAADRARAFDAIRYGTLSGGLDAALDMVLAHIGAVSLGERAALAKARAEVAA